MTTTDNFSQSILQSSESSIPLQNSFSSLSGETNGGIIDKIKNINITTWFLIILIMAFLGFNVFKYLASGTDTVTKTFAPILKSVFGITIGAASQAIDISAEGAKNVVSGTAGALETGLSAIQEITPTDNVGKQAPPPTEKNLKNILNVASKKQNEQINHDYEAQEASSSINNINKSGWCYIGEDRGFRTCAEVGVHDKCLSGDIFPTHEICMNPNLRE